MKAGWEAAALGQVCDKIQDGAHHSPKNTVPVREPGTFPYVTSKNIRNWYLDEDNVTYVGPEFHDSIYPRCNAEFGDVLLTKDGANTGQVTINTFREPISLLSSVCLIKPNRSKLDPRFLVYYIQSDAGFENITGQMTGAAIKRIILKNIKSSEIPLPPLEEQQRIVAVLDEAFEGLARARAHAEANLQNVRELFENSLEAELEAVGSSKETSLGEHIDLLAGFAFKSKGYTEDQNSMRLMRGDNIVPGAVRWEGAKYWPIDDCEAYEKFQLKADDVLIAMDRTWIKAGIKYAVLSDNDVPSLLVQRVSRLRCLATLDTHFLAMLIGSKSFERYVLSIQTGTGVPHISPTQIRDFQFPLPDIDTQAKIVERLLIVKNSSSELSEAYSKKLQDFDDLRQSLLQKAFAGELT